MCRFAAYLGEPVLIEDLLYEPDAALVRQAVDPELMSLLNLGGFGLAAWDPGSPDPGRPLTYQEYDAARTSTGTCGCCAARSGRARWWLTCAGSFTTAASVLARTISIRFCSRARASRCAQNGDLYDFGRMRYDLLEYIDPQLAGLIEGTTDTEWVYALVLSQLEDPFLPVGPEEAARAVERTLEILRELRGRRQIATQSPVNLVLIDGTWMLATRYAYDYGWYPDDGSFFADEREHDFTSCWWRKTTSSDSAAGRRDVRHGRRGGDLRGDRKRAAHQAHRRLARGPRVFDARVHPCRGREARRRHPRAGLVDTATRQAEGGTADRKACLEASYASRLAFRPTSCATESSRQQPDHHEDCGDDAGQLQHENCQPPQQEAKKHWRLYVIPAKAGTQA